MAGGGCGRLLSVAVMAILVVAAVSEWSAPAPAPAPAVVEAQKTTCCATTTQGVVSYCRNVLGSKYFTATITCCIMAQHQPPECWCQIRRALGDDALGPNCLKGASC